MSDERDDESHEEHETPAVERHENHEERSEWESQAKTAMRESLEIRQTVNQDLALQARRMDDLAKLHESHLRQWEESLAEVRELMKSAREAQAASDQARSELVAVTAAQVKIAQVQQAMLQALQEESQS